MFHNLKACVLWREMSASQGNGTLNVVVLAARSDTHRRASHLVGLAKLPRMRRKNIFGMKRPACLPFKSPKTLGLYSFISALYCILPQPRLPTPPLPPTRRSTQFGWWGGAGLGRSTFIVIFLQNSVIHIHPTREWKGVGFTP